MTPNWVLEVERVCLQIYMIVHLKNRLHLISQIRYLACRGGYTLFLHNAYLLLSRLHVMLDEITNRLYCTLRLRCVRLTMDKSAAQAISGLIPTFAGPLPPELLELAVSLLAQSRSRASSLKAEEEIARSYACANLACERCEQSSYTTDRVFY